ncbi:LacI family transcriptional regulator, partial [Paenibacillus darwinianus]
PAPAKRIALVAPIRAGELGDAMRLGADAAAKEFGVELVYASFQPEEGAANQQATALQILREGVSAILIDPADGEVLSAVAGQASRSGIPLLTLNDERKDKGVQASIAIDNEEAGRKAGEAMARLIGGEGVVAVLGPARTDPDTSRREDGIVSALAGYPRIAVGRKLTCGDSLSPCREAVRELLDGGEVDGIFALDSQTSIAAAEETASHERQGELKIVTFGNELAQLELLQDGIIHNSVVQNGFSAGYLGVKQAVSLLDGQRVDKSTRIETKVIDAENMFWMDNQKLLFPFVQ